MKRISRLIAAVLLLCPTLLAEAGEKAGREQEQYSNLPFEMKAVAEPEIPDYSVSITDFGGVADGKTLNTKSFERAIKHLTERGGGRLVVPFGVWYTGPIELKSRINLHLEDGALVLFSSNRADYPLVDSYFEGVRSRRCMSPLTASGAENIAITGNGVFNGNGQHWRPVKKGKMTAGQWSALCKSGALNAKKDIWYPSAEIRDISNDKSYMEEAYRLDSDEAWNRVHDFLRPALLSFIGCRNILLEDATFENSPGWNIHPLMCENVILRDVTIRNPWFSQNGDGLDLESCRNAVITGCLFDVGDDAICIKSGRDKEGRDRGMPTENVIISDCRVYHGHGGFVIGSEMSGGARNISVSNCLFIGTDCGLRFKSTRGRGGVVEKIFIDNIGMADIPGDAITFDLYYGGKAPLETSDTANGKKQALAIPAADETTPSFRDINISNVTCRGAKRAIHLNGLPEMPIRNITIRNSSYVSQQGAMLNHIDGLTMDNVTIDNTEGEAIVKKDNVRNVVIK